MIIRNSHYDVTALCERDYPVETTALEQKRGNRALGQYVLITTWAGEPVAVSANGFVLSVIPVVMENGDLPGLVHWEVFRRSTRAMLDKGIRLENTEVVYADRWRGPRVPHTDLTRESKWLPYESIINRASDMSVVDAGRAFSFDFKLLHSLTRALNETQLVFQRNHDNAPTLVVPAIGEYRDNVKPPFGVIMPMYVRSGSNGANGFSIKGADHAAAASTS